MENEKIKLIFVTKNVTTFGTAFYLFSCIFFYFKMYEKFEEIMKYYDIFFCYLLRV
jgi:hypothetical protein